MGRKNDGSTPGEKQGNNRNKISAQKQTSRNEKINAKLNHRGKTDKNHKIKNHHSSLSKIKQQSRRFLQYLDLLPTSFRLIFLAPPLRLGCDVQAHIAKAV